jgi:hypothetical protein
MRPPTADRRPGPFFVVSAAKQKKLDDAERELAEYLKAEPTKIPERARMEGELAKAYQEAE